MDFKIYNKNKNGKTIKCEKDFLKCCYKIVENDDFICYVDGYRKNSAYINIKSGNEWYRFWDTGSYCGVNSIIAGGKYGSFHNEDAIYYSLISEILNVEMVSDVSMYIRALKGELTVDDIVSILDGCDDEYIISNIAYFTEEEVEFRYDKDDEKIFIKVGDTFIEVNLHFDDVYKLIYNSPIDVSPCLTEAYENYSKKEDLNRLYVANYGGAIRNILDKVNKNESISLHEFNKIVRKFMVDDVKKEFGTREYRVAKTYVMVDKSNNMYKIGKSIDPKVRERTLQSEKPSIEMLYIIDRDVESVLHRSFSHKRVRGEWFNLVADDLNHIIENYNAALVN